MNARFHDERGEGMVSALILIAGVLLPLLFVVPLFARLEQGRLIAEQTARDAVRVAVEAPSADAAQQAANAAVERGRAETDEPLQVVLHGTFVRGGTLQANTTVQVALASLPFFGSLGTIQVHGQARAPVDQYRSLVEDATP
jgi:hypothetical protein